jgi:peptidoglycan/xylan/chitin deacetylase (PgdA/CDA1 family)
MATDGKHGVKNHLFRDFFDQLADEDATDLRWRDVVPGVRDHDTTHYRGSTEGGPDSLAADPTRANSRAMLGTVVAGTSQGLSTRNAGGGNYWFGVDNVLDLTLHHGSQSIGGTTLIDGTASFDATYLGKKVCFYEASPVEWRTIVSVTNSTTVELDSDASALSDTGYVVMDASHLELWYHIPDNGADSDKPVNIRVKISSGDGNPNADEIDIDVLGTAESPNFPQNYFNGRSPGWHQAILPLAQFTPETGTRFDQINTAQIALGSTSSGTYSVTLAELNLFKLDDSPRIAITVDDGIYSGDGGTTVNGTTYIASVLDEYGVKGTFYVIGRYTDVSGNPNTRLSEGDLGLPGNNVYCNKEDFLALQARGHLIANHTWDSPRGYEDNDVPGTLDAEYVGEAGVSNYLDSVRRMNEWLREYGFHGYDLLALPFGEIRRDVVEALMRPGQPICRQIRTVMAMNDVNPHHRFASEQTPDDFYNYRHWPLFTDPVIPVSVNLDLSNSGSNPSLIDLVKQHKCTVTCYTHTMSPGSSKETELRAICQAAVDGEIETILVNEMLPSGATSGSGGSGGGRALGLGL